MSHPMKPSTLRFPKLIEPLAFSAYVAWYIWQLQASYFRAWLIFPVWMLASFMFHGDTPKTIGWRADNLWSAAKRSAVILAPCAAGLFLAGIFLGVSPRSEEHTSELQSHLNIVCRLLLEKKKHLTSSYDPVLVGSSGMICALSTH